jgi:hypothetical protein
LRVKRRGLPAQRLELLGVARKLGRDCRRHLVLGRRDHGGGPAVAAAFAAFNEEPMPATSVAAVVNISGAAITYDNPSLSGQRPDHRHDYHDDVPDWWTLATN